MGRHRGTSPEEASSAAPSSSVGGHSAQSGPASQWRCAAMSGSSRRAQSRPGTGTSSSSSWLNHGRNPARASSDTHSQAALRCCCCYFCEGAMIRLHRHAASPPAPPAPPAPPLPPLPPSPRPSAVPPCARARGCAAGAPGPPSARPRAPWTCGSSSHQAAHSARGPSVFAAPRRAAPCPSAHQRPLRAEASQPPMARPAP
mmetsp:Transcript_20279/g.44729  ORF Transcript_20279/g.44729 Transcript_20279/m.44729 type:complete len:201 (+) Transcript_20279:194-796(+)